MVRKNCIRKLRQERGKSLSWLHKRCKAAAKGFGKKELSKPYLSNIENQKIEPKITNALIISLAMGYSIEELWEVENGKK